MHFAVDVIARDLKTAAERVATSCVIIFVALDAPDGKPTPVPAWHPGNDEDRRLADYAQRLIELSKTMEAEVSRFRTSARS
jgi:acyl-CoA hydrolase